MVEIRVGKHRVFTHDVEDLDISLACLADDLGDGKTGLV